MAHRILAFALLLLAPLPAAVKPADVFGSHMVLQRDRPLPVWGSAAPGEVVTVTLGATSQTGCADPSGRWSVTLPPRSAGGPFTLVVAGTDRVVYTDVLVGDLWICSGQSNMEWPVSRSNNAKAEIAAARHPGIRFCMVPRRSAPRPRIDLKTRWRVCSPRTIGRCTAVGYYFGRHLHRELKVPIGLVHVAWGGTRAEAWTPRPTLERLPACANILTWWRNLMLERPRRLLHHEAALARWERSCIRARYFGERPPRRPAPPPGPGHPQQPGGLWNGMIHPLLPMAVKGVIWYQGEANTFFTAQYGEMFPALIRSWRAAWKRPDLPFLFVQLAGFARGRGDWPGLREAQAKALVLPHTAMAVALDIGAPRDIHPRNKQEVGRRLALGALAKAYGRTLVYSGPVYAAHEITGNRVVLRFSHRGGGLTHTGRRLAGFALAGPDRRFHPARARIEGDAVVLHAPAVPKPVAVRYGWAAWTPANLTNREGLPAPPFRTDTW